MRQAFPYDPSIRKKAEEEGWLEDGVIRLETFFVTEKEVSPYLVRDLEHKREIFEVNKPSVTNGASKSITPAVKLGVMPYDYKSLPNPLSVPAWNLINIRL